MAVQVGPLRLPLLIPVHRAPTPQTDYDGNDVGEGCLHRGERGGAEGGSGHRGLGRTGTGDGGNQLLFYINPG